MLAFVRPAFARLHADLLTAARRASRRPDEAEDLVQTALLAAIDAGRTDFSDPATRRWLCGVIRKRAAFDARTAVRRRRRETETARLQLAESDPEPATVHPPLDALSPALRLTAQLALSGHTRQEICWLLNLTDAALRQRITQLRRALRRHDATTPQASDGLLAYGRIRCALLAPVRRPNALLASHDPDGHLFVLSRSQN